MRRDPSGPPGVVEACIAEAALAMRDAAPRRSPWARTAGRPRPVSMARGKSGCSLAAAGLVHRWYDVNGLARFKNKFDPYWIPRYGAIRRRRGLVGFIIGLLRVHLADAIHFPGRRRAARRAVAA